MPELPPIHREVIVAADPTRAFEVFTDEISGWWPLERLSVLEGASLVSFEDGRIVEATMDGREAVWGEVLTWEPPTLVRFTWHPGSPKDQATEVTVSFSPVAEGTLVVLEHAGWEARANPAEARAEYNEGWVGVLELLRGHVAPEGEAAETWVALMHSPGPAAPAEGSLFEDPRFSEHLAFLERMGERGFLVAAGPLGTDGSGMTILRLPGAARHAEVDELATTDDLAVSGGLLAVDVRPWNVLFHTLS